MKNDIYDILNKIPENDWRDLFATYHHEQEVNDWHKTSKDGHCFSTADWIVFRNVIQDFIRDKFKKIV